MTRFGKNRIRAGLLLFLAALLPACGGTMADLHTADSLVPAGPMQRIAVLSGGQVVYFTSEGYGVDIPWSRQALHSITQKLCDGLQDKGYTVTFCQTAGIGFRGTGTASLWLYDIDANGGRTLIPDGEHVPLADPLLNEHADIQAAVRRVFTAIEDAAARQRPVAPALPSADIQLLGKILHADALCMNRVHGEKQSKGYQRRIRRAASGQRNVQTGLIRPSLVCVDAASGDVLWQQDASLQAVFTRSAGDGGVVYREEPLRKMLERFPRPGGAPDPDRAGTANECHRSRGTAES